MPDSPLSRLLFVGVLLSLGAGPDARSERLTLVASINELVVVNGLTGVDSLHLSPDDRFVFATALGDQSIASYPRDPVTGALSFGDVERDGFGGVDGIETPGDPGVDAVGRHLYVPGSGEDALAVFEVDASGGLDFVEAQREGFAGVAGLDAPVVARVSPDGAFVYAAGTTAIAIFERDAATGALDWVAQQVLPSYTEKTLALELSPDGSTLYVGTDEDTLHAYARNALTGLLALVDTETGGSGGVPGLYDVYSMAVSRDGRNLYAGSINEVVVFDRASDGTLASTQHTYTGGTQIRVALAPDGLGLWTSASSLGGVLTWVQSFFPRDPVTGLLGSHQAGLFQGKNMEHGRIAPSRDGRHLYVSDSRNDDTVAVIDVASVKPLGFVERQGDGAAGVNGLDGARSAAVSPDGRHVYVAGLVDDAVAIFSRDAATGTLDFMEAELDGVSGVDGLDGAIDVTLGPDGKHVYVCGAVDDAVAVFSRNASTGALTFVEMQKDGVGAVAGLDDAYASTVSPDGKHLYVVSLLDDAVTTFSRNAASGALSLVEEKREGFAGVSGLNGATDVAVSPSGGHVYVASSIGDSVAVFTRNSATGVLGFVESLFDGPGSSALNGAAGIAVSRDGRHVYVVANVDDSISTFSVGTGGTLTLVEEITDTTVLTDGLDGARGIAVTADDRHVVVASVNSNGMSVFRRDPATGELGYAQLEYDPALDGLAGAHGVAASPDGRHVYVAGSLDDALVAFAPEPGAAGLAAAASGALIALRRRRRRHRS